MKTSELVPSYEEVQKGVSWVGGPTNQLQRQHLPNYAGHVHSLIAENQHGKTFARVTAECLNGRVLPGFDPDLEQHYKTNYNQEFSKPNKRNTVLADAGETILSNLKHQQRQFEESLKQTYQSQPKSIEDIPPIDRVPVVGYMGHRPVYRHPLRKVQPTNEQQIQKDEFLELDENLQRTLLKANPQIRQKRDQPSLVKTDLRKSIKINALSSLLDNQYEQKEPPVMGYTGFQKGVRAENMFGKTFKDISQQSLSRK